jgi:hypothetical protein
VPAAPARHRHRHAHHWLAGPTGTSAALSRRPAVATSAATSRPSIASAIPDVLDVLDDLDALDGYDTRVTRLRAWSVQPGPGAPELIRGDPAAGVRSTADYEAVVAPVRPQRLDMRGLHLPRARMLSARRRTPAPRRPRDQEARERVRDGAVPTGYPGWGGNDARPERATAEPQPPCGERPWGSHTSDHFRLFRKWSPEPLREQENRATARFLKPSSGLEPETPSLPWQPGEA